MVGEWLYAALSAIPEVSDVGKVTGAPRVRRRVWVRERGIDGVGEQRHHAQLVRGQRLPHLLAQSERARVSLRRSAPQV